MSFYEWLDIFIASWIGLTLGSLFNLIVYRVPRGIDIVFKPSYCESCGNKIKAYHNIPVVSWIFLMGKCAYCEGEVSIEHPFYELLSMVVFIFLVTFNGLTVCSIVLYLSFMIVSGYMRVRRNKIKEHRDG